MRSTARFYPAFTFLQIPFWLCKWDKSVSLHSFRISLIWIACPPCTSKHHFGDIIAEFIYKTTFPQIHNSVCLWDKDGGLFTSPDLIKNAARWLVGYFSLINVSEAWKRIWPKRVREDKYFELCDFSRENTNIETYWCTISVADLEGACGACAPP